MGQFIVIWLKPLHYTVDTRLGGKIVTPHSCIGRKEKVVQVNKVWNKETSVFNLFCHHGKKSFIVGGASKKSGFALRISLVEVEGCRRGIRTNTFTLIFFFQCHPGWN